MTLGKLLIYVTIAAVALTAAVTIFKKDQKSLLMSFVQNFCGALFMFSGWVKVVDPLGMAYKIEQYFAEFESTFSETWFSFIAPLFPWLSEHSISVAMFVIVFEMVLAVMLLLGARPKFTSWAFLLLVAFFTVLTGFTYLTGYVPQGVNFFEFGNWGDYVETNMKVTDCGCFGDFLVLKPKTSFLKDVFLLFPAIYLVLRHQDMHQLWSRGLRTLIVGISLVGLTIYGLSNFVWDIPHADFRPFKEAVNVRAQKALEEEAENNIEIIAYKATNKATGQTVEIPYAQYLKEFKKYPKEEWKLDQIKTEPSIPRSKISDFEVSDVDGNDMTEDILNNPDYQFMIVAYKLKYDSEMNTVQVQDEMITYDTSAVENFPDSISIDTIVKFETREERKEVYTFEPSYRNAWENVLNPVLAAAEKEGIPSFAVTAYADPALLDDFRHATQSAYPFYLADDILLKTIVRSNPGVVLMKNGEVIKKWHYKKLPDWAEIKSNFLK